MPTNGDRSDLTDHFVVLYARSEQEIFRFVASLVPVRADAEDITQNVASVLWRKFAEYDQARPFVPWAIGIARFEVLNFLQRKETHAKNFSTRVVEELADQRAGLDERLVAERSALDNCLEKLPTDDRELLETRYREQASLTEQAERLNCNVNALYKRLGRIRNKLTECVRLALKKEGWS